MSFGISLTDMLECIKLLHRMYDYGFSRVNSADARYLQFRVDIRNLHSSLQKLNSVFRGAAVRQSINSDFDVGVLAKDGPDALIPQEWVDLVGDFTATVRECNKILFNNVALEQDPSGFFTNIRWNLTIQGKIEALRDRFQLHIERIDMIVRPVELGLAADTNEMVAELHALQTDQAREPLRDVSGPLDERFRDALRRNPPPAFTDIEHFPLREGFDVLHTLYNESIEAGTGNQAIEQWLALLKATWVLKTLKRSVPYTETLFSSPYRKAIKRMEQLLLKRYNSVQAFSDDELEVLNDEAFEIWPVEREVIPRLLTEEDESEEKILDISISSSEKQTENLVFFRTSDTTLRIARNQVFQGSETALRQFSESINVHQDRLIPWYAVNPSHGVLSLELRKWNGTGGKEYELRTEKDLFNFQRAITGYSVVSESLRVSWTLSCKKLRVGSKLMGGDSEGRVQIWQYKPLTRMADVGSSTTDSSPLNSLQRRSSNQSGPSSTSDVSRLTNATVAKLTQGYENSILTTVAVDDNKTVVAAKRPYAPVLILFTVVKGKYTFLHVELSRNMNIVPTSCKCARSPDSCLRVVIENKAPRNASEPFTVRKLSVSKDGLGSWDLSVFGRPRHPEFSTEDRVEKLTVNFFNLDFPSVKAKQKFMRDWKVTLYLRDEAEANYNTALNRAVSLSNTPNKYASINRATTLPTLSHWSSATSDTVFSQACTVDGVAPRLDSISCSPTFDDAMPWDKEFGPRALGKG